MTLKTWVLPVFQLFRYAFYRGLPPQYGSTFLLYHFTLLLSNIFAMKNIDTFIGFSISKRGLLATVLPFLYVMALVAQPTVLYTGLTSTTPAPSNSRYTLNTVGGFRQFRFQANQTVSASSTGWAFHSGSTGSPNYSPCWRPTNSNNTLSSNTFIPTSFANGANYQSSGGGSDGLLPAITSGNYYTFNVANSGSASSNMALLETTYSPVTVSTTVTQASGTYGSRTINITTSATPNSGEYVFVRYSTNSYSNSTLVQATGSGTAWTATIPWQSSAVSFYVYTSNRTLAAINSDVTTYGQSVHDMSTLNLNNNSGSNYSWTPATGAIIVSSTGGSFASGSGYSSFTNTSGAFAALNSATSGTGAVTVLITADVSNEASSKSLNASTNWTSMTISPSGARTISGATTTALIELNGADNVTIDGLNTGSNALTISNTSTSSGTSTIRFVGGATTNTLTNCTILGASTSPAGNTGGTIFFSTDAVTTTGNDNNTISNCNIGSSGSNLATKGIYGSGSIGTTAVNNSGITISNNNIYDFFGAAVTSAGIYVTTGNTDWTISNNKFYQTTTRTQSTGKQHSALSIANTTSGNNFTITGNTIGYSAPDGTGTYTIIGDSSTTFVPISLSLSSTGTASSVQNNTIAGIAMSGIQSGTSAAGPIICIQVKDGLVNIGDIAGNTIGSTSAIGNITYTSSATTRSDISGIYVESSSTTMIVANNTIGGITVANSTTTGGANIYGIVLSTSGAVTCQNNTIGGTVANSLQSTSTATVSAINGIYNNGKIAIISGNTIRNISTAGGTKTADLASVIGISSVADTTNVVSQNTIYNLSNSFVGTTIVTGIYIGNGATNTVSRNTIHSLTAASIASTLNGINTDLGTTTYSNNIIRLGIDGAGTSTTTGMIINGIYEQGGTNKFYYNTVYVGGNSVTGAAATYAFTGVGAATRVYQNNIFQNVRSNSGGGTGKHYAIKITNLTGLTINNNLYFANGTGGVLANFNGTDKTDITAWRTATSQDANSINVAPVFSNATGDATAVNLHLTTGSGNNCSIKGASATGTGITVDYDGDTRSAIQPGIGADEFGVKVAVTAISGTTPACTSTVLTPTTTPTTGLTYTWGNPTAIGGATSGTYTVTATGSYNVTITETSSGCAASATSASAITINPLPTITLGSNPSVCRGITAANLPYSATTNSPNQYSITYNAAAITAGFANAPNATLPTTPIVLTVPAAATAATYNATLTVTNSATGCVSAASNITATVNALPIIALAQVNDPCQISVGSITVTITGGAPNYSIAACGTTIAPSPTVGQYIAVTGSPATVTTSGSSTSFSNLQGNATYKLTVTDTNGCIGQ
jgi:trimeric autotransporter adhesin